MDTPIEFGVEIDVRSYNNKIVLNHDLMRDGETLNNWIKKFNHKFLIINIKEEGLEKYIRKILKKKKIKEFFFLDQSFPFLVKTINSKEKRCAVRFSEYEDIKTIINLKKQSPNLSGFNGSIETSGSIFAQSVAIDILAPKGRAVYLGLSKGKPSISPEQFIHKQITIIGSKVLPSCLALEMMEFAMSFSIKHLSIRVIVVARLFPATD